MNILRFRKLTSFLILASLIEIKSSSIINNERRQLKEFKAEVNQERLYVHDNKNDVNITNLISNRLNRKSITTEDEKQEYIDESKHYAYFVGTAYCSYSFIYLFECNLCKTLLKKDIYIIRPLENNKEHLFGFIAEDSYRKEIILSIRGSVDVMQILKLVTFNNDPYPGVPNATVHRRFFEYTKLLLPLIIYSLQDIFNQHHFQGYKLILTGHSLGGAIAVLALPIIKKSLDLSWDSISIYTYGQPRVGNEAFALWYDKLPITYVRYVNGRDLVPHLPLYDLGYRHSNKEFFNFNGKLTLCRDNEENNDDCSNNLNYYSPFRVPHTRAWDIDLVDQKCYNGEKSDDFMKFISENKQFHPKLRNLFLPDGSVNPDFYLQSYIMLLKKYSQLRK